MSRFIFKHKLGLLTVFGLFGFIMTAGAAWAACTATQCVPWDTSTWACGTGGCNAGERRQCLCGPPGFFGNNGYSCWECSCVADASCTTGGGTTPPPPSGGGGGGCTVSQPNLINLVSPNNGAVLPSNNTALAWNNRVGWGAGCPTIPTNTVFLQKNCTGLWTNMGNVSSVSNLDWNTTYCWQVLRSNGARSRWSEIWRFRTVSPPRIIASGFDASTINKCASASSGSINFAGTNNPIKFTMDVTDDNNNFSGGINRFNVARIAVIESANPFLSALPGITGGHDPAGRVGASFQVSNLLAASPTFAAVESTLNPYYGATKTSGDLTIPPGHVTLVGINTAATRVDRLNNTTLRITITLRFENNYSTRDVGIYGMIMSQHGGVNVSQDPAPPENVRFTRLASWRVDVNPPAVSISDPAFSTPTNFQVNWQASDQSSFRTLRSYCYITGGSSVGIRDNTVGQNLTFGTTPLNYPGADQCLISSAGRLGNHSYQVTSGTLSGIANYRLYAEDAACNSTSVLNGSGNAASWIYTSGSNVSAGGGFNNLTIGDPDAATIATISPTLGTESYLATFLTMSGNNSLPSNRESERDTYTTNYQNLDIDPPPVTGVTSWYDWAKQTLAEQGVLVNTNQTTLSGNLSSAANYNRAPGSTLYINHTGNLTINSGTRCDLGAVILVQGNLTIAPDFINTAGNGCMFVVKGNITVTAGVHQSAGLPTTANARYDRIHGFFVADGNFSAPPDTFGPGQVADGLYIKGSIIARNVNLNRELGRNHNALQPSEVIEYDAYYLNKFKDALGVKKFNIREL